MPPVRQSGANLSGDAAWFSTPAFQDSVNTQRRWDAYRKVRDWYVLAHHMIPEAEKDTWEQALRLFHVARVASWQVDCADKGGSKYLTYNGENEAKRFREAEQKLWVFWDEHAERATAWAAEHGDVLQDLEQNSCEKDLEKRREMYEDKFEKGTAKAVYALAFEDWRDGIQPPKN
eukprot:CAMPEP_0174372330 /NCGR_PEP_ID=MMETSP0811_2-20130205/103238_1 /TAXON_ID=73025 ORGANISM="Eutreptiella gymnastica-like, Strain CCMP1594" /NCGR_SAMPLE_ID=MMETSP0811_2 /ASSEMBLY_ACC=CAM_ASM_000667 /LENGTH=174 /DNA_ID=CAMNT_0015519643 /DNA_START=65 /DNA_END=588 /DNA_ORIENTATION=-